MALGDGLCRRISGGQGRMNRQLIAAQIQAEMSILICRVLTARALEYEADGFYERTHRASYDSLAYICFCARSPLVLLFESVALLVGWQLERALNIHADAHIIMHQRSICKLIHDFLLEVHVRDPMHGVEDDTVLIQLRFNACGIGGIHP